MYLKQTMFLGLGFIGPCNLTHSNESTNQMQQLITGLLFVVQIPLNMFRASLCTSLGAYQLQQLPLVYRWNVVVAVLLAVVGPTALLPPRSYGKPEAATAVDRLLMMCIRMPETTNNKPVINCCIWLVDSFEHASRAQNVAAILQLQSVLHVMLFLMPNALFFCTSTSRSTCEVSNMAAFCGFLTFCLPGMLLRNFLDDFLMVPVAPIIKVSLLSLHSTCPKFLWQGLYIL